MQLHIKRPGEDDYRAPKRDEPMPEDTFPVEDEPFSDEEPEQKSWKTSRYVWLLLAGAVVLFAGMIYVARHYESGEPLVAVKVEGNKHLLTSEILKLADINRSQKFYDIDLAAIEQRVARHGFIRDVSVRREVHPNTIVIHVDERLPLALLRTASGEPMLIDNDFRMFLPKRLEGLRDPNRLLAVPVLDGVSARDTASIMEMAHIVKEIETTGDSSLSEAIGELRRTPTGAYVMYTSFSMTPIFLGSPTDVRFTTALERETNPAEAQAHNERLFDHQLHLLAELWKTKLRDNIFARKTLYVDARFNGQIIVRPVSAGLRGAPRAPMPDTSVAIKTDTARLYTTVTNTAKP